MCGRTDKKSATSEALITIVTLENLVQKFRSLIAPLVSNQRKMRISYTLSMLSAIIKILSASYSPTHVDFQCFRDGDLQIINYEQKDTGITGGPSPVNIDSKWSNNLLKNEDLALGFADSLRTNQSASGAPPHYKMEASVHMNTKVVAILIHVLLFLYVLLKD